MQSPYDLCILKNNELILTSLKPDEDMMNDLVTAGYLDEEDKEGLLDTRGRVEYYTENMILRKVLQHPMQNIPFMFRAIPYPLLEDWAGYVDSRTALYKFLAILQVRRPELYTTLRDSHVAYMMAKVPHMMQGAEAETDVIDKKILQTLNKSE